MSLLLAPLRIEARALRCGAVTTGAGPRRAAAAAARLAATAPDAVAVAGVGGGLDAGLRPGDLVVADRVVDDAGALVADLPSAPALAAALREAGLPAVTGTVASSPTLVRGDARRRLADRTGAAAVAMEDAALVSARWGAPIAVVRAVADTPARELLSPATLLGGLAALRSLRVAGPVLLRWTTAVLTERLSSPVTPEVS